MVEGPLAFTELHLYFRNDESRVREGTFQITLPAHASIFTGLLPIAHGVRNNGNFYLADRFPTLATILKAQGYRTAAFVSSFILDRRYGLARGFDSYDDRMEGAETQVVALEAR